MKNQKGMWVNDLGWPRISSKNAGSQVVLKRIRHSSSTMSSTPLLSPLTAHILYRQDFLSFDPPPPLPLPISARFELFPIRKITNVGICRPPLPPLGCWHNMWTVPNCNRISRCWSRTLNTDSAKAANSALGAPESVSAASRSECGYLYNFTFHKNGVTAQATSLASMDDINPYICRPSCRPSCGGVAAYLH